ncbi:MAG: hypothetical protein R3321_06285 [Nitrososphaeraceae archaeon]|nr:hypothetical protein [Nitrososphaeraceae archaeon]
MANLITRIQFCQEQLKKAQVENNSFLIMLYEQELESRFDQLADLRSEVE